MFRIQIWIRISVDPFYFDLPEPDPFSKKFAKIMEYSHTKNHTKPQKHQIFTGCVIHDPFVYNESVKENPDPKHSALNKDIFYPRSS